MTFLTLDGRIVRLPAEKVRSKLLTPTFSHPRTPNMPSHDEQKLCIGSSFLLQATNGHNPSRRVNLEGFCHSCDYLYEVLDETVRLQRGTILDEEREVKGTMHEVLKITVAIPYLWSVPPQLECLSNAIQAGGGVVHRSYLQWII